MVRKYSVANGLLIERVGNDLLVVVHGKNELVRLSGDAANLLLSVQAGETVRGSESALANLEQLGVITTAGVSRRGLIKASAIGAGAGIAVMAMPGVAAASSACPLVSPIGGGASILFYPDGGTYLGFLGGSNFSVQYEFLPNGTYYFDFVIPDMEGVGSIEPQTYEDSWTHTEGAIASSYGFLVAGEATDLPGLLAAITVRLYSDPERNCLITTVRPTPP